MEQRSVQLLPQKSRENAAGSGSVRKVSTSSDMFELLNDLQSARLNDQRSNMPRGNNSQVNIECNANPWLQDVLRHPPPYPMIAVPPNGGYWLEASEGSKRPDPRCWISKEDCDKSAKAFANQFKGQEHQNYYGLDSTENPIVISVKLDPNGFFDVVIRTNEKTEVACVKESQAPSDAKLTWLSQQARIDCDCLYPVICPRASEMILKFDQHSIMDKFKFGILYQKFGQLTEEAIFGNRTHSAAMDEFLEMLGQKVELSSHEGYRGGLDTKHGQTGTHSVYQVHKDHEIMFHVSTLLPYVETDPQQLQRKCHIGNDIVAIVFQDANTPFSPDMITSHFLHAYIVVQPLDPCTDKTRYRVSVTAKEDVPHFLSPLPSPAIFRKGPEFANFLLDKLINAEMAALRGAAQFKRLEQRTRSSLLANLYQDLTAMTTQYLGIPEYPTDVSGSGAETTGRNKPQSSSTIIESVKRALSSKSKLESATNGNSSGGGMLTSHREHIRLSKSKSTLGYDAFQPSPNALHLNSVKPPSVSPQRETDSGRGSIDMERRWSSVQNPAQLQLHRPHHNNFNNGTSHSESDDSSLNSVEVEDHSNNGSQGPLGVGAPPPQGPYISGSVTTVPIEGVSPNSSASGQLRDNRLRDELSKIKGDKLELLRQNMSAQRELKLLRERENQLQTDLSMASREIQRLHRNARSGQS